MLKSLKLYQLFYACIINICPKYAKKKKNIHIAVQVNYVIYISHFERTINFINAGILRQVCCAHMTHFFL